MLCGTYSTVLDFISAVIFPMSLFEMTTGHLIVVMCEGSVSLQLVSQCPRDGFLSSVARSLQKKVGGTAAPPVSSTASGTTEAENLEDSMRKVRTVTQ